MTLYHSNYDSIDKLTKQCADIKTDGQVEPERREKYRRKVMRNGTISLQNGTVSLSCRLKNMSQYGVLAKIDVLAELPDRFVFYVNGDTVRREAELAWRDREWIGIRFL